MVKCKSLDDFASINGLDLIQCQQYWLRSRQSLQTTHIVGQSRRFAGNSAQMVIPAGPCPPASGKQRHIGMQYGLILLIREGGQYIPFLPGRVAEKSKCLVGVNGEHDMIVTVMSARRRLQLDEVPVTRHALHRAG